MHKLVVALALLAGVVGGSAAHAQATDTPGRFTWDVETLHSNDLHLDLTGRGWQAVLPNLNPYVALGPAFVDAVNAAEEPTASLLNYPVAAWAYTSRNSLNYTYYTLRYRSVTEAEQALLMLKGSPWLTGISIGSVDPDYGFPPSGAPKPVPPPADVAPAAGMWAFEGELTGKPGRGFQIDYQGGKFVILSYFGYRAEGSATFMQASGQLAGDRFEGDLVEFRGGTVLSQRHRDGEAASTAGRVQITFDSPTSGLIRLPGESPKRIQRFQYEDLSERFNHDFFVQVYGRNEAEEQDRERMTITARDGKITLTTPTCRHEGTFRPADKGIRVALIYSCVNEEIIDFLTGTMVVDEHGFLSGDLFGLDSVLAFAYRGTCIGAVTDNGRNTRCRFE